MALPARFCYSDSPEVRHPMSAPICTHCQVAMVERTGFPGCWICPQDPSHTYDAEPAPTEEAPARRLADYANLGTVGTRRHWLSHLGITEPLPTVKQGSNMGDGSGCLPLGDIKRSGGGSSGRRRKKPRKLRRELWGT